MELKIGQFARICQVSVVTLRHYDDMGLLKPSHVDHWTGYRYYDLDQVRTFNRIIVLKEMGLSLDQIKRLIQEELPIEQIRGMLRLRQSELEQQTQELQEQIRRVQARIQQIELEGQMPEYDVVLKRVESIRGAILHETVRKEIMKVVSNEGAYIHLFDEVADYLRSQGLTKTDVSGAPMDIWYGPPDNLPEEVHIAVFIPTDREVPGNDRIKIEELPAVEQMVCVVHNGPWNTISPAYVAALQWIEQNGYRWTEANRGIYLQYDRKGNPDDFITELQFPVVRV